MTHYVHNISPFAIQLTKDFGIRWYGLAYLSGFIAGYYTVYHLAKRRTTPIPMDKIADLVTLIAIGVMVGGRLGYCLFYSPKLFLEFSGSFPFWGVLEVHKGGMASHGGLAGVILVCLYYAWRNGYSKLHIMDLCCFGGAIGFMFGRIANFINGELYGREAPESLWWAMKFPSEIFFWQNYETAKLKTLGPAAEALGQIDLASGPMVVSTSLWQDWTARMGMDHLASVNVNRVVDMIVEAAENHQQKVLDALQTILTPRYPSQLIQSFLEGFLVLIVLIIVWIKPRKPGVIAGWFGFLYAVMRIIGEQFRMPDAQIGYQWLGLTRGQWLSFAFVALGLILLWLSARQKNAPLMGGWFATGARFRD